MQKYKIGIFIAFALISSSATAAVTNLITNGDFSQTTSASGMGNINNGVPTAWTGIQGQTDNATVVNGVMLFSTMGTHSPTQHKYYISQTFTASEAGNYTLSFDYLLGNAYAGNIQNGAKVVIDQWYASAPNVTPAYQPNIVFSATYGSDHSNAWHLNQSVLLNLTAGNHTLYIGTLGPSNRNDQAAVLYDNVSISRVVSSVPEPETYATLLAGLGILGAVSRRRQNHNI